MPTARRSHTGCANHKNKIMLANLMNLTAPIESVLILTQTAAIVAAVLMYRRRSGWKVRIHHAGTGETLGVYSLGWTESAQCYKSSLSGLQLLKSCASTHGFVNGTPDQWCGADFHKKEISVRVTPRG